MTIPIINAATVMPEQAYKAFMRFVPQGTPNTAPVFGEYTSYDVLNVILPAYWVVCDRAGIDFGVALAQAWHETAANGIPFSSWWAQRPRRNPCGFGVTGRVEMSAIPPSGVWARKGLRWAEGHSFANWRDYAIPAHVGRLVAYATKPGQRTGVQQELAAYALGLRGLPAGYIGAAPTLDGLDGRWAVPGNGYGAKIARIMQAMRGL